MLTAQVQVKQRQRKKRKKTVWSTNWKTVQAWKSGKYDEGRNPTRSIFFEGSTIYSYGHHFPMAVRTINTRGEDFYVLNGDTDSITTSCHQQLVRSAMMDEDYVIIPFSALNRAGIDPADVQVIDQEPERYLTLKRRDRNGEIREYEVHLMGSSLFQDKDGNRWLSGLDEGAVDPWSSFFLTQLVDNTVSSVAEAYLSLMPEEVFDAKRKGKEVLRQGEWFFVRAGEQETKKLRGKEKKKWYVLIHPTTKGNHHKVREAVVTEDGVYVRGTCRHTAHYPEHKMLRFGKYWYKAYPNRQVKSFGARGRID